MLKLQNVNIELIRSERGMSKMKSRFSASEWTGMILLLRNKVVRSGNLLCVNKKDQFSID